MGEKEARSNRKKDANSLLTGSIGEIPGGKKKPGTEESETRNRRHGEASSLLTGSTGDTTQGKKKPGAEETGTRTVFLRKALGRLRGGKAT